jgi:hypothetical protein
MYLFFTARPEGFRTVRLLWVGQVYNVGSNYKSLDESSELGH